LLATARFAPSLRQHDRVAQHDGGTAHLDVAAGLQVLHHAAHHLARGADHLGDVLLGQALGDHFLAVHVLRHVEQQARHAPVDVEQRQAADLAVGLAQPAHQAAHHRHVHLEVLGQALLEVALGDRQQLAGLNGDHRRRARLVVDQAHLAEELARAEDAEDHFLALGVAHHDLEAAREHDVERIGGVPARHDGRRARRALSRHHHGEHAQLLFGKAREDGNGFEYRGGDRCGHSEMLAFCE